MNQHTLIDELLLEQQSLTAVERFSQRHADVEQPLQERFYRDLIPLSAPEEGEQYAFEVDLSACSGCKACVSACHHLNGLSPNESWRDVGLLLGEDDGVAVQQTVTTACHHCLDPACANGCPTLAYEKDVSTGIVKHLDDQCMGCRYCELKCPYQVPKFHQDLGIVRKCDLCQDRLAESEAPACVQACPNEAIRIRIVPQALPETERLLPGVMNSDYTKPLTRYTGLHPAKMQPADKAHLHAAHAHWPLVWMLVMVPMSIGMAVSAWFQPHSGTGLLLLATVLGSAGLAGSVLHLGRPSQAWKAFLGWRRSWLSREIIAFNAWISALVAFTAARWFAMPPFLQNLLGASVTVLGLAGLFASTMVYADTQRPFWRWSHTAWRFGATALIAGLIISPFPLVALLPVVVLLGFEAAILFEPDTDMLKPSHLMRQVLKHSVMVRAFSALLGLALLVSGYQWPALMVFAISELAARSLFFRAVDEPKMPGIA